MRSDVSLALVSVKRIEKFLAEEDVPAWVTSLSRGQEDEDGQQPVAEPGSIRFNQASFIWPQSEESRKTETFILGPVTLDLPVGKLTIVTGPTGSGKTSFLSAILGGQSPFHLFLGLAILSFRPVLYRLRPNDQSSSMLTEMDCIEGSVLVDKSDGKLAYASQTAWLESATIRENIVFQSEFDQSRYGNKILSFTLLQP
jgi:ABC-type multidrug transport system fused ATPase/permease subunit